MKIGDIEFPDFDGKANDVSLGAKWFEYSSSDGDYHEVALDMDDFEDWITFKSEDDGDTWKWGEREVNPVTGEKNVHQWHPVGRATPKTIIRKVTARRLGIG